MFSSGEGNGRNCVVWCGEGRGRGEDLKGRGFVEDWMGREEKGWKTRREEGSDGWGLCFGVLIGRVWFG